MPKHSIEIKAKNILRKFWYTKDVVAHMFGCGELERTCPCCGYRGIFDSFGHPPRYSACCPICKSLERQRLFALVEKYYGLILNKDVLHFAPEPSLRKFLYQRAKRYITADLNPDMVDYKINIEEINQPDEHWDVIICSHVLEHVNDRLALSELNRILKIGGYLLTMVPIIEGWDKTTNVQLRIE